MRSRKELIERLFYYGEADFIYSKDGYIAWQTATGENIEILFIEVREPGNGVATRLVKEMCEKIDPFNSVIVFRLASNETAGYFYRKLGFKEYRIPSLYRGVDAMLGVVNYETLCRILSIRKVSGNNE